MAEFKMPELNSVVIAGNLTKDPIFRQTTNGTPVVNFSIASNRRFRDKNEDWKVFDFKFSPTEEYTDISAFYKEISEQGYKITFQSVSSSRTV